MQLIGVGRWGCRGWQEAVGGHDALPRQEAGRQAVMVCLSRRQCRTRTGLEIVVPLFSDNLAWYSA